MDGTPGPAAGGGRDGEAAKDPLVFAFWDVQAAIVRDNLARHAAETGDAVTADCISGGYDAVVGAALAAGGGPDVFYAQRAEAALWGDRGWIAPLDEGHPAIAPLLARMDPRLVAGARDAGGRLLGTTYYNGGPFALYLRPGEDRDLPTWASVLDACRAAKRDGVSEHPLVPRWHRTQTGLVWSLLCHLASEGVTDVGAPGAEAMLAEALAVFDALWREGLVPAESLDDAGDGPALARWARGRHLMSFTTDYLAADAAVMAGRPVSLPAARLPGRTGTPLMPGHALICLRAGLDGARREAAIRLAAGLGGPAPDGSLRVHRRWLADCLFAVPYPEVMADAGLLAAIERFFPAKDAGMAVDRMQAARAGAVVSPMTHRPFMLAWTEAADQVIREALLRAGWLSPAGAAGRIVEIWAEMAAKHGAGASA